MDEPADQRSGNGLAERCAMMVKLAASRSPGNATCCRTWCNLTGHVDHRITASQPSLFLVVTSLWGPKEARLGATLSWYDEAMALAVECREGVSESVGTRDELARWHSDIRSNIGPLLVWGRYLAGGDSIL